MYVSYHRSAQCSQYQSTVHLERLGSLSETTVQFYMAELSSALGFLHSHKIIHRYVPPPPF